MTVLVTSLTLTMVACSPKQDASKSTTTTNKTEYITDINKDNVEEIVVEYKELLSYYNDLKANLKIVSGVSKNSNSESDLTSAKESLDSKYKLVKDAKIKYKPLADAQANLVEMYSLSQKMADSVVKDKKTYNKTVIEYNKKFKEYKKQMDQIRQDIEKIKNKTEDSEDSKTNKEDKNTDKESNKSSDNSKNTESDTSIPKEAKSHTSTTKYRKEAKKTSGTTVPFVSTLTSELEAQITSAGASEGEAFKKSGGSKEQAKEKASELFDELENDSPIQKSDREEAKTLFIKAFMGAFN